MPDTLIDILVERLNGLMPRIAIVLGSGLGSLVDEVSDAIRVPYTELPGFPASGVSGHAGELVAGYLGGEPVMMLSGRVHYYEKGDPAAMRAVIEALAGLGVQSLILTNSAGSVRQDIPPGSVMQITDHINYSGMNPLIGEESDNRFVGMTTAYDPDLMLAMRNAAIRATVPLFGGVYMWFSGPSFETPAEIRMARLLGADAVGMSTVPEVILARFFGMRVAAASVITNYGAGMTGAELSHEETKDMAPVGGKRLAAILKEMIAGGA
ncbi:MULTISPECIES: purine-nucleoside phosphorylase [Agrobacterium]|jgi:purine-nucleoside phosphorylase|uniref:Purine nucleoside phosphorylase n=1 Tax=Agrobacterium tumefaciens TaxID=358 RepID=A0AA44JAV8_AGRTU|nr:MULTISPECIES: purine-nucleoside phosphorylase [Agrobacterium]QDG91906.1 purine-nucleoside phosphorylase [Rhizobium sp. NIBRBAC000502774]ADY63117.1 Purine nucleoside phosphorylase [Agrobacterium tumefaciens]AYM12105.1 purine nucleoside phosphorylase [Agrobacterium tumefaciens]MDP9761471.1 purine-nucleoside phosphorylase [Agrobacterium tumefaciens]MDQ1221239.1 purine-nucleoside phosphorylase [Agrobacterium sp. SORGH_AS_0745]